MSVIKSSIYFQKKNTLDKSLSKRQFLSKYALKCDPILYWIAAKVTRFFPVYHMSKAGWIIAALDGSVPDNQIRMLLDMSCDAAVQKAGRKPNENKTGKEEHA